MPSLDYDPASERVSWYHDGLIQRAIVEQIPWHERMPKPEPVSELPKPRLCPKCGAWGDEPCVSRTGKPTKPTHRGREHYTGCRICDRPVAARRWYCEECRDEVRHETWRRNAQRQRERRSEAA